MNELYEEPGDLTAEKFVVEFAVVAACSTGTCQTEFNIYIIQMFM